jgi:hypothetical protein
MLTSNGIKQEISLIYLHTLATSLGYSFELTRVDMDSVDATICARGQVSGSRDILRSPKIALQLKATEQEFLGESFPFCVSKKNYDDLRQITMVPKILVVLFLPVGMNWFEFNPEKIGIYGKAYWKSLKGETESENKSSVTVYFSQAQRITEGTIQQLMIAAANREEFTYVPC